MDSISKLCDVPNLNETMMKTPTGSEKRNHRHKFIAGGMAERLLKLVRREKSEIAFWEHKYRSLKEKDIGQFIIINS